MKKGKKMAEFFKDWILEIERRDNEKRGGRERKKREEQILAADQIEWSWLTRDEKCHFNPYIVSHMHLTWSFRPES
jgi:hypothetical protein